MRDKFDEFRFSIRKRKAPKCNCQLRDTHALPCVHLLFVWRERNKGSPGTVPLQLVDIVERPYRLDAWLTMWCGVPSSSLVPLSPLGAALLRRHPCTLKEPNIDGDTIASATNDKKYSAPAKERIRKRAQSQRRNEKVRGKRRALHVRRASTGEWEHKSARQANRLVETGFSLADVTRLVRNKNRAHALVRRQLNASRRGTLSASRRRALLSLR